MFAPCIFALPALPGMKRSPQVAHANGLFEMIFVALLEVNEMSAPKAGDQTDLAPLLSLISTQRTIVVQHFAGHEAFGLASALRDALPALTSQPSFDMGSDRVVAEPQPRQ